MLKTAVVYALVGLIAAAAVTTTAVVTGGVPVPVWAWLTGWYCLFAYAAVAGGTLVGVWESRAEFGTREELVGFVLLRLSWLVALSPVVLPYILVRACLRPPVPEVLDMSATATPPADTGAPEPATPVLGPADPAGRTVWLSGEQLARIREVLKQSQAAARSLADAQNDSLTLKPRDVTAHVNAHLNAGNELEAIVRAADAPAPF